MVLTSFIFQVFYQKSPSIFSLRTFFMFVVYTIGNDNQYLNPEGEIIVNQENNIGFNSHIDFDMDSLGADDYAIIGDSFVASYQTGAFNSIAYFLDEQLPHQKVYNFGVKGGNINDYNLIYKKYGLNKLKKVFLVLTGSNDLIYAEPYKKIERSHTFDLKIFTLIEERIRQKRRFLKPNFDLIHNNGPNIVLIVHDGLKTEILRKNGIQLDVIELNLGPEYRLADNHYSPFGNKKIAEYILNSLNKPSNSEILTPQEHNISE